MKEFLERNSVGTEILHQSGDDYAIQTLADIETNLKRNKVLQTHTDGYNAARDMKHIASIPVVVVQEWNRKYNCDVLHKSNIKLFRRLVNDRDNSMFRTSPGVF
jgi:hypothetical protein